MNANANRQPSEIHPNRLYRPEHLEAMLGTRCLWGRSIADRNVLPATAVRSALQFWVTRAKHEMGGC